MRDVGDMGGDVVVEEDGVPAGGFGFAGYVNQEVRVGVAAEGVDVDGVAHPAMLRACRGTLPRDQPSARLIASGARAFTRPCTP